MTISPARDPADPPAAPPDWTIEVGSEPVGESFYFFADVKRAGKAMFRVGIGGVAEEEKAKKLLAAKAREWIGEFLIREQQSGASSQDC